jgi:hypothetical protein
MDVEGIPIMGMAGRKCWRARPKVCHSSISLAIAEATRLEQKDRRRRRAGRRLVVYWCPVHQTWHVGHDRRQEKQGPLAGSDRQEAK